MKVKNFLISAVMALSMVACATVVPLSQIEENWLSFLKPGETRRVDVLSRLGVPTSQFEGERILTYRMNFVKGRGLVPAGSPLRGPHVITLPGAYHLILVFDEKALLTKYKLLKP